MSLIDKALAAAAERGRDAGENAAAWIEQDSWGGRVARSRDARENARAFLDTYEEGGSFFFELAPPRLSGEHAGDPTPASLLADVCWDCKADAGEQIDLEADIDDLCTAWENACAEAFWSTLEASARAVVESEGNR